MNKLNNNLDKENRGSKNFLKKHVNSIIFLLLLTVIVSLITYYRVLVQMEIGPVSDSFDFLSNALVFAGQGIGYSDLFRPPLFPFIISLFFRLGYVFSSTIFIVDGLIFIFGVIGMFLFLKLQFNDIESFLGGLLYATFPIVLSLLGFGFSDLASVSFTIWTFYFLVLAVKRDSKFFYLAFPFFILAFLTRYNNALMIFPILFYLMINRGRINFKNLYTGIIASILIIVPVLILFYEKFGNIIAPFINFGSISTLFSSTIESNAYNPNLLFYLQKFPEFLGIQSFIILLIVALGVVLYLFIRFMGKNLNKNNSIKDLGLKNKNTQIKLILVVLFGIIFLGSFGKTVYLVSELLFFVITYLFYDLTKNRNLKYYDIHIMVFAWFMAFFIFQSVFVFKTNRYFLPMVPPLAYFMILGLSEISKAIKLNFRNMNVTFPIIAIILTSIILLSTASIIPQIVPANKDIVVQNEQIELASQWFMSYDPNYKNQNIYSDTWPNFSWYLRTNVKMVPTFSAYVTNPDGVRNYTINQADVTAFNNYLIANNADYFLSDIPGLNLRFLYSNKRVWQCNYLQKENLKPLNYLEDIL